jgi:ASC-1-like (ASCH) protein
MTIEENRLYDSYQQLLHSEAYKALEDTCKEVADNFNSTSFLYKQHKSLEYAAGVLEGLNVVLGFRSIIEQALAEREA